MHIFNHINNKFILRLEKDVYPYGYMDDWEKFNETSLPEKEDADYWCRLHARKKNL